MNGDFMDLLDLPIEKQKECAARRGMGLDEWQAYQQQLTQDFDNHQITGVMDEETSKHFADKMKSATQDV